MVLFACVENTFRSVMAEALFNANAPPGWRAISAGVDAKGDRINPVAVTLLAEIGIDVKKKRPQQVTPQMIRDAYRLVTFGCLDRCPSGGAGKNEDWPLPGSTAEAVTVAVTFPSSKRPLFGLTLALHAVRPLPPLHSTVISKEPVIVFFPDF